jgi:zinc finger CCHC domain-containing protein 8
LAFDDRSQLPIANVLSFSLGPTTDISCFSTSRVDKDDSQCFNCGSYSHALQDCLKPRDNVAISNARK